jgi:hypothetical protein
MHFAAARTAMGYGDIARAFRHYHEGNALKRSSLPSYDVADDERNMQSIATTVDRAFLEHGAHGNPSPLPIFVVGMPRSGTTLVEQILALTRPASCRICAQSCARCPTRRRRHRGRRARLSRSYCASCT